MYRPNDDVKICTPRQLLVELNEKTLQMRSQFVYITGFDIHLLSVFSAKLIALHTKSRDSFLLYY